MNKVTAS